MALVRPTPILFRKLPIFSAQFPRYQAHLEDGAEARRCQDLKAVRSIRNQHPYLHPIRSKQFCPCPTKTNQTTPTSHQQRGVNRSRRKSQTGRRRNPTQSTGYCRYWDTRTCRLCSCLRPIKVTHVDSFNFHLWCHFLAFPFMQRCFSDSIA